MVAKSDKVRGSGHDRDFRVDGGREGFSWPVAGDLEPVAFGRASLDIGLEPVAQVPLSSGGG